METSTKTISIILLLGLISVPILLFVGIKKWYRLKYEVLSYLTLGLIVTASITWIFTWWADYSNQLLMSHYGYDFDAMSDAKRFEKVASKNLERVKQLEIEYFGIGWPLKAIMTFVFYSPYLLIVYLIGQLIKKNEKRK
ncbi:MAG: hypothetical protein AAF992_02100 [Bacteroidota bacterium]